MRKATIAGGVVILFVLLVLATGYQVLKRDIDPAIILSIEEAFAAHPSFIYGRITTTDGIIYEGRLRWGGIEEAFWGDYFNGFKDQNPWAALVPPERLKEGRPIEIFGVKIARWESQVNLGRPFMARFGDIVRIEAKGRDLWATLKSGTVFHLDRFNADDLADGVRVWNDRGGVVDLDEWQIRTVELLPSSRPDTNANRLHGTVRTSVGEFTGFIQWDRQECIGSDELDGYTPGSKLSLRFDTIRSIARNSRDSTLVTLLDGGEIVLSGTRKVSHDNRGIHVDDRRYGRVLVSWDAFERVDFSPGGSGPAYPDFPAGSPLAGSVTTRAGRRLAGRLVYDLDESETTETLDAPFRGVNYNIPFGMIASIVLPARAEGGTQRVRLTLHSGEELQLDNAGDLGEGNGGLLVFVDDSEPPEYVPWTDVEQIELDRPAAMYPPLGGSQDLESSSTGT